MGPEALRRAVDNMQAIQWLQEPASSEELMRLLGPSNYFSRFIEHFADMARPLYAVLKGTGFAKKRGRGQRFIIKDWQVEARTN